MPIDTEIVPSRDLTIFTAVGGLTLDVVLATQRSFYEGEPTANILWDFREVTGARISPKDVEHINAYIASHQDRRPTGRTALVVATTADFGMARVSATLAGIAGVRSEIKVFRSLDEAHVWLESEPEITE